MKRILFIINNLNNGGAEKVLINLVNRMDHNRFDITLRCLVNEGENIKRLDPTIKYEYVFKKGFIGINFLHLLPNKYIYNKVAHGKYDVIIVYLHGVLTKIISYKPSTQKTIAYLHANMENSKFMQSFFSDKTRENCFKSYNAIVSVSKDVENSFVEVTGIKNNLRTIYNTFDRESIIEQSKEQFSFSKDDDDQLIIVSVGKLNNVKGYNRLVKVAHKLHSEGYRFRLYIIGSGNSYEELKEYITRNSLNETVFLEGFQSNPYKYINNADIFVCSSFSEGFSSVVVESIILGIPVITTNCAGMKEILGDNNDYGMIVENTEEGLFSGLKEFLCSKMLLSNYREKASERSSFFEPHKTVKDVENLIEEVLNV